MKKLLLSASAFALVAASSMVLAPSKAEAIPAFARQTGSACLDCHFQEIPALAPYGRAFKEGSFTMVGDQALVEGDNLSIPSVLNATMVVAMSANHKTGGTTPTAGNSSTYTNYTLPVDTNFLVAGRIGAHTGAFVEFGGGAGDTGQAANNIQMMNSWDMGGFKVGFGFADTSFGGDAVMNVSSVYGQHSGNVGGIGSDVGAINNSGFTNSTSEIGAWVGNDMGYLMFGLVAPGGAAGWNAATNTTVAPLTSATQGGVNVGLKMAKLIRLVGTFDLGGFDTVVGGTIVTGQVGKGAVNASNNSTVFSKPNDMKMTSIDAQMQGNLGDMTLGVYADWAHAKGTANGNIYGAQDVTALASTNAALVGTSAAGLGIGSVLYNGSKFDAYSLRASLEPVTGITFGVGYGHRKTSSLNAAQDFGAPAGTTNGSNTHSIWDVGVSYQLYMNSVIALKYSSDNNTVTGNASNRTNTTTLDWHTYM